MNDSEDGHANQAAFSLTRFLAKYWLESTIGTLAVLILLVGIIVSQTGSHGGAIGTDAVETAFPAAMGVLPGKPLFALDAISCDGKPQPPQHDRHAHLSIPAGETLQLVGWAVDQAAQSAPSSIFVQIDEFARVQGILGNRPDVAQAYKNPNYARSGYAFDIPASMLGPGTHRLSLLVGNGARTGFYVQPNWISLTVLGAPPPSKRAGLLPGVPEYSLDSVVVADRSISVAGEQPALVTMRASDPLVLAGWAIDQASKTPAAGVVAVIDGNTKFRANYGSTREDVASAYHAAALAPSGFVITIPAGSLSKGNHTVSLKILSSSGSGFYLVKDRVKLTVE